MGEISHSVLFAQKAAIGAMSTCALGTFVGGKSMKIPTRIIFGVFLLQSITWGELGSAREKGGNLAPLHSIDRGLCKKKAQPHKLGNKC